MKTTTTNRFSSEQVAYMKAKALVETLRAKMNAFNVTNAPVTEDESAVDAYLEASDKYARSLGYYDAMTVLAEAENNLFAWASATIKANATYGQRFGEIAIVFEKAPRNVQHRAKLVDICMKFAA